MYVAVRWPQPALWLPASGGGSISAGGEVRAAWQPNTNLNLEIALQ